MKSQRTNPALRLIWRRDPSASLDGQSLGYGALSVANGMVLVGEYGCGSVSYPNGYVQAFNPSTGVRVWSKPMSPLGGPLDQMVASGGYVVAAGSSARFGQVVTVRLRRRVTGSQPPHYWPRRAACPVGGSSSAASSAARRAATCTRQIRPAPWLTWIRRRERRSTRWTGQPRYSPSTATGPMPTAAAWAAAPTASSTAAGGGTRCLGRPRTWLPRPAGDLHLDQGSALNTGTGQAIVSLWDCAATGTAESTSTRPAMSDHDARPVAGLLEHRGEVTDLGLQGQRRNRIARAQAGPVVGHDPSARRDDRQHSRPGQRPGFAERRVEHNRRAARASLLPAQCAVISP